MSSSQMPKGVEHKIIRISEIAEYKYVFITDAERRGAPYVGSLLFGIVKMSSSQMPKGVEHQQNLRRLVESWKCLHHRCRKALSTNRICAAWSSLGNVFITDAER